MGTPACPVCPTNRLGELFGGSADGSVTVFAWGGHGHTHMTQVWSELYSATGELISDSFGRTDHYNFEVQSLAYLDEPMTLRATDTIKTYCVYDTSDDEVAVVGGDATENEMCLTFFLYYPKPTAANQNPALMYCLGDQELFLDGVDGMEGIDATERRSLAIARD